MINIARRFLAILYSVFVLLSAIWVGLFIWFKLPDFFNLVAIFLWLGFVIFCLKNYFYPKKLNQKRTLFLYCSAFIISLIYFFSLTPQQERQWSPDVAKTLHVERHENVVTLHNVRHFKWRSETDYDIRWETRTINLNDLQSVNLITSYWMGEQIAHTLVSFDIKNAPPLTFSIEIRKQANQSFSALGGFFRQFELSLIAADEKDILYTRSNIRHEEVYFFPIRLPQTEVKALFEEYLLTAQQLEQQPQWYNTLTSNCTTLVFDMVQRISKQDLPLDYRLLLSGYLPNYVYDLKGLDQNLSIAQWYQHAHINPKVSQKNNLSSQQYSQQIRDLDFKIATENAD